MPGPFPGMDPYLERADLWPDFRHQLVRALQNALAVALAGRYHTAPGRRQLPPEAAGAGGLAEEDYVEVRERKTGKLVTLVDVVSPAHKTTDAGRQAYLATRRAGGDAGANLAEVDLVLQGRPTLEYSRDALPFWHYAVTVTRASQPDRYEIYTATLQKRLPRFRLPLAARDRDAVLDLQAAFDRCYGQGDFAARIDYGAEPPAPLGEEDGRWVDEALTARGLRPPAPPEGQVAVAAYYLWEQEGRPHGRDREHWRAARSRLRRGQGRPG